MSSLQNGRFEEARSLLTGTQGGATLMSMAPDFLERINRYIGYAQTLQRMASGGISPEQLLREAAGTGLQDILSSIAPEMGDYMDRVQDLMGAVQDMQAIGQTIMAMNIGNLGDLISVESLDMLSNLGSIADFANLADLSQIADIAGALSDITANIPDLMSIQSLEDIGGLLSGAALNFIQGQLDDFQGQITDFMSGITDQISNLTSMVDQFASLGDTLTALNPAQFQDLILSQGQNMMGDLLSSIPDFSNMASIMGDLDAITQVMPDLTEQMSNLDIRMPDLGGMLTL